MGTMINRRRVCSGKKSLLPSGYTQLEYLKSTGTQFFNLGYIAKNNTVIDIDFKSEKISGEPFTCLFGSQKSSNDYGRFYIVFGETLKMQLNIPRRSDMTGYIHDDGTVKAYPPGIVTYFTNKRVHYIVDIANKILQIGNRIWNASNFFTEQFIAPTYNLYLLTRNTNGVGDSNCSKGLLYASIIKEGNTIVRNYIPCRRNSDNVLGMYDTVTGNFLTNAGTGTFIAGPEV